MEQAKGADSRPFFSVVVPSYNRAFILERTLDSCLCQTFEDFEVVIVDDGSSDNTEAVVAGFEDPRIVYIRQPNGGASAARNRGATEARGTYLAFLDSDDVFLPGKLAAFHAAIDAAGEDAPGQVWYSPLYFHRGDSNRLTKPERAIGPRELVGDYLFAADGMMQTSTLVMTRDLFLQVRFNPRLRNLEDLDLCLRLEAIGARFVMLPEPQVVWYDDRSEGRLSYTTTAENVRNWLDLHNDLLSERARFGFLARYLVPVAIRKQPLEAVRVLAAAVRHDSISAKRAASLLVRGAMPEMYGRLRDAVVSLRPST